MQEGGISCKTQNRGNPGLLYSTILIRTQKGINRQREIQRNEAYSAW